VPLLPLALRDYYPQPVHNPKNFSAVFGAGDNYYHPIARKGLQALPK